MAHQQSYYGYDLLNENIKGQFQGLTRKVGRVGGALTVVSQTEKN